MGDKTALSEIIIGSVSRLLNSQSWLITRVVKLQIRMSPSRKYNCFLNDYLHLLSVSLFYWLANISFGPKRSVNLMTLKVPGTLHN